MSEDHILNSSLVFPQLLCKQYKALLVFCLLVLRDLLICVIRASLGIFLSLREKKKTSSFAISASLGLLRLFLINLAAFQMLLAGFGFKKKIPFNSNNLQSSCYCKTVIELIGNSWMKIKTLLCSLKGILGPCESWLMCVALFLISLLNFTKGISKKLQTCILLIVLFYFPHFD